MMAAFRLGDVLNFSLARIADCIRERSAASQKVPDPAQELSAHAQARAMLCVRTLDYRTSLGSGDLVAQQATVEHVPSED